jgi:hypothetical protein
MAYNNLIKVMNSWQILSHCLFSYLPIDESILLTATKLQLNLS